MKVRDVLLGSRRKDHGMDIINIHCLQVYYFQSLEIQLKKNL